MQPLTLETERLRLVLGTVEDVRAMIESMPEEHRAQLSPAWLAMVSEATEPDPWLHGFGLFKSGEEDSIGDCGFKGPPDKEGVVEIAYSVHPDHQGNGYATEAAARLTQYAMADSAVRLVIAHTLREANASTRVLTKCGFEKTADVIDPDDGPVWRWEWREA